MPIRSVLAKNHARACVAAIARKGPTDANSGLTRLAAAGAALLVETMATRAAKPRRKSKAKKKAKAKKRAA